MGGGSGERSSVDTLLRRREAVRVGVAFVLGFFLVAVFTFAPGAFLRAAVFFLLLLPDPLGADDFLRERAAEAFLTVARFADFFLVGRFVVDRAACLLVRAFFFAAALVVLRRDGARVVLLVAFFLATAGSLQAPTRSHRG